MQPSVVQQKHVKHVVSTYKKYKCLKNRTKNTWYIKKATVNTRVLTAAKKKRNPMRDSAPYTAVAGTKEKPIPGILTREPHPCSRDVKLP